MSARVVGSIAIIDSGLLHYNGHRVEVTQLVYTHAYITDHYNPSLRITIQFLTPLNVTPNDRFFDKVVMTI